MKDIAIETKMQSSVNGLRSMLIRIGNNAVKTEFADLILCNFPINVYQPIPLEIPANNRKSVMLGSFGRVKDSSFGEFKNLIKLPRYSSQHEISVDDFNRAVPVPDDKDNPYVTMPVCALATKICSVGQNERHDKVMNVLLVWQDGTSVILSLDYFDGEDSEGTPNAEWHIKASQGQPFEKALRNYYDASLPGPGDREKTFHIYMTPAALGDAILGEQGRQIDDPGWQREWIFESRESYLRSLDLLVEQLAETSTQIS